MAKEKLDFIPCPFCGERKTLKEECNGGHCFIQCYYCGARGPFNKGNLTAGMLWGRRAIWASDNSKIEPLETFEIEL